MTISNDEFIARLAEALNEDPAEVTAETTLADLEGWDSVGQLATIALVDECFQKRLAVDELRAARTVAALIELVRRDAA
jgi:acyl carrier protein